MCCFGFLYTDEMNSDEETTLREVLLDAFVTGVQLIDAHGVDYPGPEENNLAGSKVVAWHVARHDGVMKYVVARPREGVIVAPRPDLVLLLVESETRTDGREPVNTFVLYYGSDGHYHLTWYKVEDASPEAIARMSDENPDWLDTLVRGEDADDTDLTEHLEVSMDIANQLAFGAATHAAHAAAREKKSDD